MIYIKFETQTWAFKAKELLKVHNIMSGVKRNPNPDRKQGCNFALFVKGDIMKAQDIINKAGIPNLGIESFG